MQENEILIKKSVKKHNLFAYSKEKLYLCIEFSKRIETVKQQEENFAPLWELNSIWETLTEEERERVQQHVEVVHFAKNQVIHYDGQESSHMGMLLRGKVRIYKEGIGQRQQIIRLLKPYDIFGYRACIAHGPYNSNASAFEDCVLYRLNREEFVRLVRENGAFCYEVMRMMARDLAISEIRTVNLTQKHIRGRLAESLLLLIHNYGYEADGRTLAMILPREDLANMSNMTTSNAIRTLSQFAQEEQIAIDGKHIRILNQKELEKISRLG